MQTGQNSIAPESSLPQLGQVRWGSVFMETTASPKYRLFDDLETVGFGRHSSAGDLPRHFPFSDTSLSKTSQ
jgi:hypothetical protein